MALTSTRKESNSSNPKHENINIAQGLSNQILREIKRKLKIKKRSILNVIVYKNEQMHLFSSYPTNPHFYMPTYGLENYCYTPLSTLNSITQYYNPYKPYYGYGVQEWNPMQYTNYGSIPTATSLYNSYSNVSQMCPYTGTFVTPAVVPVLPLVAKDTANYTYNQSFEQISPASEAEVYYDTVDTHTEQTGVQKADDLESYLRLPEEVFPTARMLTIDPNPIVDEFCKIKNVGDHASWILDLEFGFPRAPVTRPIPVYNVQNNSIFCNNSSAVHPGFEKCDQNFKKTFLFYYDSVISTWYKGYVLMKADNSVKNFQSWLMLPMQVLGMCWP